jgi:hypothetical protein
MLHTLLTKFRKVISLQWLINLKNRLKFKLFKSYVFNFIHECSLLHRVSNYHIVSSNFSTQIIHDQNNASVTHDGGAILFDLFAIIILFFLHLGYVHLDDV